MQTGAATVENSMEVPQKIKNGTALWLNNSTSGNLSKETQITNLKEYKPPYVRCSIVKQPRCPSDEWIKKLWYIYTMEYYSAIKKEISPFAILQ